MRILIPSGWKKNWIILQGISQEACSKPSIWNATHCFNGDHHRHCTQKNFKKFLSCAISEVFCIFCRSEAEYELNSSLCSPLPDNCWIYHYDSEVCSSTPGCMWTLCQQGLPVGQQLDPWEEEGSEHIEEYHMVEEACEKWKAQFSIIERAAKATPVADASEFCELTGKLSCILKVMQCQAAGFICRLWYCPALTACRKADCRKLCAHSLVVTAIDLNNI